MNDPTFARRSRITRRPGVVHATVPGDHDHRSVISTRRAGTDVVFGALGAMRARDFERTKITADVVTVVRGIWHVYSEPRSVSPGLRRSGPRLCGRVRARQGSARCARRYAALTRPARLPGSTLSERWRNVRTRGMLQARARDPVKPFGQRQVPSSAEGTRPTSVASHGRPSTLVPCRRTKKSKSPRKYMLGYSATKTTSS